jgi:ubiquinol-cytochrome c reductase cytochrome b subunit
VSLRRRITNWLEHRTGIETAVRNFLYDEIPASAGWRNVFGSVALFAFLVQAFTGILLAFNYAPTPGDAYNSLRYILTEVTGGKLIRGLHHWGASMMVVVVLLHLAQVFLWGAYKKPREATWMVGVLLLLITLAFGLTGYLLPWDNRAYWGTVVTMQIMGKAPVVGGYLARLLGGGDIGVVTFARFYALHVLLLPPLTLLLIGVHLYLVRKHGVAPVPGDEPRPKKHFFPAQVFRDTVAIFVAFAILFVMAIAARVPLERLADPTDTTYIPRPEWYFLFLFQTLKIFEGPLEVIGAVVLPNLAILLLFLVPFIDRGQLVRVGKRTFATAALALAVIGWTGLTVAAVRSTPAPATAALIDFSEPTGWIELTPVELAGVGYYRKENCDACHGASRIGPDLPNRPVRRSAEWLIEHFKRPGQMQPGSMMPPVQLEDSDLNALAAFLLKLTPRNAQALQSAPDFAVEAAMLYESHKCGSCHLTNGAGMKVGPPLNGLARRRTRTWVERHFREPQVMSPGTIMPPYKFRPRQMEAMVSYLFALPDQNASAE